MEAPVPKTETKTVAAPEAVTVPTSLRSAGSAGRFGPILALQRSAGNAAVGAMLRAGLARAKLRVGPADDPLERDADRAADLFVRAKMEDGPRSKACSCGGTCDSCRGEEEKGIRRTAISSAAPAVELSDEREAAARDLGPGRPLDEATRAPFEAHFGRDFAAVRVHDGPSAARAAGSIGARAFALGTSIAFDAGEYAPETPGGQHLLAHELAHVAQEGGAAPGAERQAHRAEDPKPPEPAAPAPGSPAERVQAALKAPEAEKYDILKFVPASSLGAMTLSEADRRELIRIIVDQPKLLLLANHQWIDPLDELALEALWAGFGKELLKLDWKSYKGLWDKSVEGGAQLANLPALQTMQKEFTEQAKSLTLDILGKSEAAINEEKIRYGLDSKTTYVVGGRYSHPTTSYSMQADSASSAGLFAAAKQLVPKLKARNDAREFHRILMQSGGTALLLDSYQKEVADAEAKTQAAQAAYEATRIDMEARFPILASYADDLGGLENLANGSTQTRAALLLKDVQERLGKIAEIRDRLNGGKEQDLNSLYKLPTVLAVTLEDMKAAPDSLPAAMVKAKAEDVKDDEAFRDMLLGAAALALGLLAAIPTGGSSLVAAGTAIAAGGAAGVSGYMAMESLDRYRFQAAASGTAFDRARALSSEEPSLAWLALDIAGAIFDLGAAATAFHAVTVTAKGVMAGEKAANALRQEVESAAKTALEGSGKAEHAAEEAVKLGERVEQSALHHAGEAAGQGEKAASKEAQAVDAAMKEGEKSLAKSVEGEAAVVGRSANGLHDLKVTKNGALVRCSDPCRFFNEAFAKVFAHDEGLAEEARALGDEARAAMQTTEPQRTDLLRAVGTKYAELESRCDAKLSELLKTPLAAAKVMTHTQVLLELEAVIGPYARRIKELYADAKVGFRGSLARGVKGPHKGGLPINLADFDVDAFIVSEDLAKAVPANRQNFRNAAKLSEFRDMQAKITQELKGQLPGLRDGAFQFRVFSAEEFAAKVGPDERYFLVE